MRAVVAPALGGRVLSLEGRGAPLLWHNPDLLDDTLSPLGERVDPESLDGFATWQNWGGEKSWVAPQGWDADDEWHGPPDRVFDAGEFAVTSCSDRGIVMRSGFDAATGLRMTRAVTVTRQGMHVRTTLRNESARVRRWAAWEVAQLPLYDADVGCPHAGVFVHVRAGSDAVPLFRLRGTLSTHRRGRLLRVPPAPAIGKLGFPGCTGAIELRHAEGPGLRLSFRVRPDEPYPDDSPGQVWLQTPVSEPLHELGGFVSTASLVELEALSPLRRLEPGASVSLSCDWTVVPAAARSGEFGRLAGVERPIG